mmetsp:Transcript_28096/g.62661  ORF Transcript_28096/g.62661 Transcript_28096/m.62661 type:complete len:200 (+) Transcript_28096:712-1311(+)
MAGECLGREGPAGGGRGPAARHLGEVQPDPGREPEPLADPHGGLAPPAGQQRGRHTAAAGGAAGPPARDGHGAVGRFGVLRALRAAPRGPREHPHARDSAAGGPHPAPRLCAGPPRHKGGSSGCPAAARPGSNGRKGRRNPASSSASRPTSSPTSSPAKSYRGPRSGPWCWRFRAGPEASQGRGPRNNGCLAIRLSLAT